MVGLGTFHKFLSTPDFNLGIANGLFRRCTYASVNCPCMSGTICWIYPLHRNEWELLWKFGVCIWCTSKVISKFSPVTKRRQGPCWKQMVYCLWVHILSRFNLLWSLIAEKIVVSLQFSGTKLRAAVSHKWKSALRRRVCDGSLSALATALISFMCYCAGQWKRET